MSSSVRVSNLPSEASISTIKSLFLSFGNIVDIKGDKSFVDIQFQDIEDAQASIDNMTGYKLFDRYLQVTRINEIKSKDQDTDNYRKPVWETEQ